MVGLLAAFGEGTRSLKDHPVAFVVNVTIQLSHALELRHDDSVNTHDVSYVDHVRQHACVIRKELHWDKCLRLRVRLGVRGVVFAGTIKECGSLLVEGLVDDSDLACGFLLDIGDARIEYDSVDVVGLCRAK